MEPQALVELADDAAAEGEYEAAYHILMAALHLAEHRGEPDAVMHIGAAGRRIGVAVEAVRLRLESAEEMERAGKARA